MACQKDELESMQSSTVTRAMNAPFQHKLLGNVRATYRRNAANSSKMAAACRRNVQPTIPNRLIFAQTVGNQSQTVILLILIAQLTNDRAGRFDSQPAFLKGPGCLIRAKRSPSS
jgi:hypothetical protein